MAVISDAVDAVGSITIDEQATLLDFLRRVAEQGRATIIEDVAEARVEFNSGATRSTSIRELIDEVRSEA